MNGVEEDMKNGIIKLIMKPPNVLTAKGFTDPEGMVLVRNSTRLIDLANMSPRRKDEGR